MDEEEIDKSVLEATERISHLEINSKRHESSSTEHDDESDGSNGNSNALKAKFNKLSLKAKDKARQGLLEEALDLFQQAYKIHQSSKLLRRINKLKEFIKEYEQEEEEDNTEDDGLVDLGNGFRLAPEISDLLYPYQKEGILWFWGLFKRSQGGILGDDMGLGKTIQVIAFLAGMFDSELMKSALIIMPVSLMPIWENEFKKWAPGIRVLSYHGNKKERTRNLDRIQRKNGVCLTTYGLIVSSHETLSETSTGSPYKWDYIILDEGHKIKNPTKTSKNVRTIPAKHHLILTGTPIQNNLREMWSLFDFTCEGKLLGTAKTFKQEYETPIVRARERDASAYEKRIGGEMAESLRKLIEPHFLRRTKAMVLKTKDGSKQDSTDDDTDSVDGNSGIVSNPKIPGVKMPERLMRKNDLIIWLQMSDTQLKIYIDFLGLERVKEMLMGSRSPLVELNVLKKICDHPRLLSAMACTQLGLDEGPREVNVDEDKENNDALDYSPASIYDYNAGPSDNTLIQESGKLVFLVALLDNLRKEGHRCLIFSQSRKMLDIIQRVLTHKDHKILRIDGTVTSIAERQHLITTFQTNSSYSCFLLTTQVGGVGITLTSADRVVIFDPSWNPATDAQAVDRAYRIGQKKSVVIYRLITCGSIEEKIYRRQIFKDALMKQATGTSKNPFRYFSRQDLRDLFILDDPTKSKTQIQLAKMHAEHRKTDANLDRHIDFLTRLDHVFGITDHDLMYSKEEVETAEEIAESGLDEAIQARVLRAQNIVAAESMAGGQQLRNPLPAPYENPKQPPLHSLPRRTSPKQEEMNDLLEKLSKKPFQTKINHFEVFKPTREDTKRFMPGNFVKKPQPIKQNEVIDLCTPPISPSKPKPLPEGSNGDIVDLTVREEGEDLETSLAGLAIQDGSGAESVTSEETLSDESVDGKADTSDLPVVLESLELQESKKSFSVEGVVDRSDPHSLDNSEAFAKQQAYSKDNSGGDDSTGNESIRVPEARMQESFCRNDLESPVGNSTTIQDYIEENHRSSCEDNISASNVIPLQLDASNANEIDCQVIQNSLTEVQEADSPLQESSSIADFQDNSLNVLPVSEQVLCGVDNSVESKSRRKSLKHKRRSISQRLFNSMEDSDDDDLSSTGNQSHASRREELSVMNLSETSASSEYLDAVSFISRKSSTCMDSSEPVVFQEDGMRESQLHDSNDEIDESITRQPRRRVQRIASSDEEDDDSVTRSYRVTRSNSPDIMETKCVNEWQGKVRGSFSGLANSGNLAGNNSPAELSYSSEGTSIEGENEGEEGHPTSRSHQQKRVLGIESGDDENSDKSPTTPDTSQDVESDYECDEDEGNRVPKQDAACSSVLKESPESGASSPSTHSSYSTTNEEGSSEEISSNGERDIESENEPRADKSYRSKRVTRIDSTDQEMDSPRDDKGSAEETPSNAEDIESDDEPGMGSDSADQKTDSSRDEGSTEETPSNAEDIESDDEPGMGNDSADQKTDSSRDEGSTEETPSNAEDIESDDEPGMGSDSADQKTDSSRDEGSTEETPSNAEDIESDDEAGMRIDSTDQETDSESVHSSSSSNDRSRDNCISVQLLHNAPPVNLTNTDGEDKLLTGRCMDVAGDDAKEEYKERKKYRCPTGRHQSDVIKIHQCACVLSQEEKNEYAEHLRVAEQFESEGMMERAVDHYVLALQVDGGDLKLHKKVLELYKQLGLSW